MKMNIINFDSIVRRDAYRNGFPNYELLDGLKAKLSSTFHKGIVEVSYDEREGFVIYDAINGVEFVVGSEEGLRIKLRELTTFFMD